MSFSIPKQYTDANINTISNTQIIPKIKYQYIYQ